MINTANRTCKHLRSCRILRLMLSQNYDVPTRSLNIDAMKQRAAEWEPSMQLNDLKRNPKRDCSDQNTTHMTVYSAWKAYVQLFARHVPKVSMVHRAIETRQHTPATDSTRPRPSSWFLLNFLQMQVSNTYDLMGSDGDRVLGRVEARIRQKVSHGISEAGEKEKGKTHENIRKQLWWKFTYGLGEKVGKARC